MMLWCQWRENCIIWMNVVAQCVWNDYYGDAAAVVLLGQWYQTNSLTSDSRADYGDAELTWWKEGARWDMRSFKANQSNCIQGANGNCHSIESLSRLTPYLAPYRIQKFLIWIFIDFFLKQSIMSPFTLKFINNLLFYRIQHSLFNSIIIIIFVSCEYIYINSHVRKCAIAITNECV